jgi:hypothetical protein
MHCLCETSLSTHHILSRQPYERKVLCARDLQNGDYGSHHVLKTESKMF